MTDEQILEIMREIVSGRLHKARYLCERYGSGCQISCKDELLKSMKNQYANFKTHVLNGNALDIFIRAFEISAKTELDSFFANTELDDETYKILAKVNKNSGEHLLDELYDYFLCNNAAYVNTYENIEEWIGWFCDKEREHEFND